MSFSFKEFKKSFYSKFNSFSVFDGKEFNYFKLALEGMKVNYIGKGKFASTIFYNNLIYRILFIYKVIKQKVNGKLKSFDYHFEIAKNFQNSDLMIIDPGRYKEDFDGNLLPIYFQNIYNSLKKDKSIFFVSQRKINGYKGFDDEYSDILLLGNIINHRYSNVLRNELKLVLNNIIAESFFTKSDLNNIKCAFEKFYEQAIFWLKILEIVKPKEIYMVCHYHNEGLIFAAKKLKIKIIEYQHGLIAKSDIFYDFPIKLKKINKDTLFCDIIRVYGEYWKNKLLEGNSYKKNQIEVLGYYQFNRQFPNQKEKEIIENFAGNKKIILVTSQTYLSSFYKKHILNLLDNLPNNYRIILKIHPNEDENIYNDLLFTNDLLITLISLEVLFKYSSFHLTIYSTTVFDSIRFNVPTFLIYEENFKEYIIEIEKDLGCGVIFNFKNLFNEKKEAVPINKDYFFKSKILF